MKMSDSLYKELKADIQVWAKLRDRDIKGASLGEMWNLFHFVMRDRNNDDSHPAFTTRQWTRGVPFWSRNGENKAMQGNDTWLNRFYAEEDLNDSHIATALRKIAKES